MFDLAIETYIKERGLGRSATLTHPVIGFGFKVTVECTNAAERNRVVTKASLRDARVAFVKLSAP